jgi:AcrR family transcriptional regulator
MAPQRVAVKKAAPKVAADPAKTRRKRSNEKFDNRREEIVDLAAELFATNGYTATGIRDIGEAAKLARGALYYYIDSKESLLGEIHDRVLDPLLESAVAINKLDESAGDRIRKISEVLVRQVVERHDHVWVFLHEYRSLTGERRATFRRKRGEFERILIMLLSAGIADGEFEISDIRLTMMAFLGMHNYTYQWVRPEQSPIDPVVLSKLYCDIFLSGISKRAPQPVRRPKRA